MTSEMEGNDEGEEGPSSPHHPHPACLFAAKSPLAAWARVPKAGVCLVSWALLRERLALQGAEAGSPWSPLYTIRQLHG